MALDNAFVILDEGRELIGKVYGTLEGCVALENAFGTLDKGRRLVGKVYGTLEGGRGP